MADGGDRSGGGGRSGRPGRGGWVAAVLVLVGIGLVVVLSGRQQTAQPFDVRSSAPDGYRALAVLLRDHGAHVGSTSVDDWLHLSRRPGSVVVVPAPELLTDAEHRSLLGAVRSGTTVVLGSPRQDHIGVDAEDHAIDSSRWVDERTLADAPARPTPPGDCDIAAFDGLGPIDTAFAGSAGPATAGSRSCYGTSGDAQVVQRPAGGARVVTLGSPYLWANARLQPDKEDGGEPLDNAAMALRLVGEPTGGDLDGAEVTFLRAVPTAGVAPDGTRSPLQLLPNGVKLALLQLVGAFVLYAWWRSRRLGRVVVEHMPVEVEGSELVSAVGDLLRRKGSPARAAEVLRHATCRDLGRRTGLPVDAPTATLVAVVAARTGRDPVALAHALVDGPVDSADALVALAATLTDIRQEVLHHHV